MSREEFLDCLVAGGLGPDGVAERVVFPGTIEQEFT